MAIRAGLIQVCINNNHLASIYNEMAKGSERAKFLTSDDLQFLSSLITYHYSGDERYSSLNFSCVDGAGRTIVPSTVPIFYAMPYRLKKEAWGKDFIYDDKFLRRYRDLHHRCIQRFGKNWDSQVNDDRIQFANHLRDKKSQSSVNVDEFVTDLYLTANEQVLEETQYRDFVTSTSSRVFGIGMPKGVKLNDKDMKDWIDSQFYIMKDRSREEDSKNTLDELVDLLAEYFDSGLPYILYYQRTWSDPKIGLKLQFGEAEKQRFKDAVKHAIHDFAQTSRVQINNDHYDDLQNLMREENSNPFSEM